MKPGGFIADADDAGTSTGQRDHRRHIVTRSSNVINRPSHAVAAHAHHHAAATHHPAPQDCGVLFGVVDIWLRHGVGAYS